MKKEDKKRNLEYGVDDLPPAGHLLALSMQHVLLMFVSVGLPVVFAGQINEGPAFTASLVTFSMLAAGIGSILQSAGLPFIGSGYLCPNVCGPSYLSLSLSAAWAGGIPLMRGMIIVAGLVEMGLAPVVGKLRRIFPEYIVGLVVAMVGVSIIRMSVTSLFGLEFRGDAIRGTDIVIGMVSLLVMVLGNLWGRGLLRAYCLLAGMFAGWALALALEPEYLQGFSRVAQSPLFALPAFGAGFGSISFDFSMMVPFVIIAVSGSLKSFGNLLAAQKISSPGLESVDFAPVRKGLLADGLSTVLSGVLGGMAVDTSSSNIGLAGSTKVLSRWIGVAAGLLFIVLAFSPKLVVAVTLMPKPVLGASIIFAGCFMICTGLLEMFGEEWEPRRTFVVGMSLIFGLSTSILPELYARAPSMIRLFFTDPLPTTTVLAVFFNILLNLDRTLFSLRRRS